MGQISGRVKSWLFPGPLSRSSAAQRDFFGGDDCEVTFRAAQFRSRQGTVLVFRDTKELLQRSSPELGCSTAERVSVGSDRARRLRSR